MLDSLRYGVTECVWKGFVLIWHPHLGVQSNFVERSATFFGHPLPDRIVSK